jgi:hypothetical protein
LGTEKDVFGRDAAGGPAHHAGEDQGEGDEQRHCRRRQEQEHRDQDQVRRHHVAGPDREPDRPGDQRVEPDQQPDDQRVDRVEEKSRDGQGDGDEEESSRRHCLDGQLPPTGPLTPVLPGILEQSLDGIT